MKRSQLVQIIREELEKNFAQQNIEDNLMGIVRGEKPQLKMGRQPNIKTIDISYAYPTNKLYAVRIDGSKVPVQQAIDTIADLTGLQLPSRGYFDDPEVEQIVAALNKKGIKAKSSEQDVS